MNVVRGKRASLLNKSHTELKVLSNEAINNSDIPPMSDEFWKNVVRNPLYKPTKLHATIRIDADVVMWLKSQGKGYQTRLNTILRQAMLDELADTQKSR